MDNRSCLLWEVGVDGFKYCLGSAFTRITWWESSWKLIGIYPNNCNENPKSLIFFLISSSKFSLDNIELQDF